ncbi:hypothetical protein NDI52_28100 [Leptolyngbya sp. PL-A3]|uniref:hypothetical protein n=1 Tax=Leptolyngbya sp. PL-A3 TaxID=2933911 RepID=UPI0032977EB6
MINRKKGTTISELRWPLEKPEFCKISKEWPPELTTQAIELVWSGYDLLKDEVLSRIDCSKANKQIEKNINSLLQLRIRRVMTGFEPFDVQHEVPEFETSYSDQAQPPSYDIAFILLADETIILPLEAKVLRTDKYISKYINEINANFLTCRYAPFSSEAGMLAYLLKGTPQEAFDNIEKRITQCTLTDHADFPNRDHKTSDHERIVPTGESYSSKFRCHHLILKILEEQLAKKLTKRRKSTKQTARKMTKEEVSTERSVEHNRD